MPADRSASGQKPRSVAKAAASVSARRSGGVGENRQRLDRLGGVGAGARQGLGQRAAPLDEPHRAVEIARPCSPVFERAPPERALLGVAAGIGDDDRQGHLAVAEIVADRLAELVLLRREIEHVVDQLEGDAEIAAEALERLLFLGRAARR